MTVDSKNGLVRGLDRQRRLAIPPETLVAAGLEPGDLVEIFTCTTDEGFPAVGIQKYTPGCLICGSTDSLTRFKNKRICQTCREEIKQCETS